MKVLFIICEGPHDAHFVGRLLKASGQYQEYKACLKDYPTPLNKFIGKKFESRNIDEIRIGKPNNPLVPICGLKKVDEDFLVFPISIGGMDKTEIAKPLLDEILSSFAQDILDRPEVDVSATSILFIYDADARGPDSTVTTWKERFSPFLPEEIKLHAEHWVAQSGYKIGIFVFTGPDGENGTLEDSLFQLFKSSNSSLLKAAKDLLEPKFEAISPGGDIVAHETKKKKAILTICGQAEKDIAGCALTIVVRDTKLLGDVFDFKDQNAQWTRLLKFINEAFD